MERFDEITGRGAKTAGSEEVGPKGVFYAPPRVVRVRVETARLTLGQRDATAFCTVHDHDTGINPCTP
jgi:hypothetical protein